MAAPTLTSGRATGRVVHFIAAGEPGFARRFGHDYWGMDRWRGWRLMGVNCRRVPPVLLAGDRRIPVRIVASADVPTAA